MPRRTGVPIRVLALVAMLATSTVAVAVTGSTAQAQVPPVTIQVLGSNDFHGRLTLSAPNGGAAVLAGAIDQLSTLHPNTVVAAAGDLVGASTFESFIQQDKPTIDALNAAGLEVSAVGNHEFDAGYADLTERIMAPFDPVTNPFGGAEWQYLGANVRNASDGSAALPESWTESFGAVDVAFIGAVTEDLPELVSPAGISTIDVESIVDTTNRVADDLRADGAEIVILLVHEGAATTDISSATDPTTAFGQIVNGVDGDVDAIVSGHTHLAYNHAIPVPEWANRPVTTRPVVSAGQYGFALNQLLFEIDPTSLQVQAIEQNILPLLTGSTPNYPADPEVAAIVAEAVADAAGPGSVALGEITGAFNRAKMPSASATTPIAENRGAESTLGNLVAEVQRAETGTDIAVMNPGGLRGDMVGTQPAPPATPAYPTVLTYKQAADVQPFANTLVRMTLTGTQIETLLEQQWQPAGASRPFLRLGLSEGLTYTYDPDAAAGDHVTAIWLHGTPLDPTAGYSVTANSFLAAGGDNFTELLNGIDRADTGKVDLQSMVDHLGANSPIGPDFTQRSVGIDFPDDTPATYRPGDTVAFAVSSLSMPSVVPSPGELHDANLVVHLDGAPVGTFPVDNAVATDLPFDEAGQAAVSFALPAGTAPGPHALVLTGDVTGTTTEVPITVEAADPATGSTTYLVATSRTHRPWWWIPTLLISATVLDDGSRPTGRIEFRQGDTVVATTRVYFGLSVYALPPTLERGVHSYTATFVPTDPTTVAGSTSDPVSVRVVGRPW